MSSRPRRCGFVVDERERWLLWAPVFFGTGIAIYFALAFEPAAWIGAVILGVGIAVGILGRR